MNIEPQELPAEALAMLVENPGSSLVAQLLQHVAHQEQAIVSLRAELATAREIAHSNLCCTAKIQAELDAERARAAELGAMARRVEELEQQARDGYQLLVNQRVDELTALLRVVKTYAEDLHNDPGMPRNWVMLDRVDQALASAGAKIPSARESAKRMGITIKEHDTNTPSGPFAEEHPLATAEAEKPETQAERRTTHACDECGLIHDASGFVPRWTAEDIAAIEKKARELAEFLGGGTVIERAEAEKDDEKRIVQDLVNEGKHERAREIYEHMKTEAHYDWCRSRRVGAGPCDCQAIQPFAAQQSAADPSPGASERLTLFVVETLAKGVVWIETGHRRGALDVAQEDLRANPPGQFPKRIVRVTEIRDVIAAGDDNG
jgi:hypothetical protein